MNKQIQQFILFSMKESHTVIIHAMLRCLDQEVHFIIKI